ncbi:histidinol-phosphatase HisJ [Paenibacillus sp. N1-5-1-14]|uniref:histidinol-phosphatase HisJ n=1 Tax=Paenibacillus radicibacter TaxID=2972488 RepID=UPI002158FD1F|nr:histidinol-phosphatase HisJ [Paenibacillus radicibacter]MCR8643341.1 histidinol-phosphatase HisJ [Paenibacillus radicibacter]
MFIDYHTHHERCGHAVGRLEEYIERGIAIGLDQLGLSDHMPLLHVDPATYLPEMAMAMDELPRYVEEALHLKEKYKGQIDIRVGLEGDYIEGYEQQIERIIKAYPWDYVIGSVHFLGTWDVSDFRQLAQWDNRDVNVVYRQYYDAVQKAAKSGLYDFLGHIDMIKRFGYKPAEDMLALERETLGIIKDNNMAIEVNASGLRHQVNSMYPSRDLLEYACQIGIPVTMGSDAHAPERLAENLEVAQKCLKEIGFTELATFCSRSRILLPF